MEGPRRTRVINCYDNWVGAEACWQGSSPQRRRAIEDIDWRHIFHGRCLLVGDFNAHSPIWNPQRGARLNAGPLEQLIEDHDLLVNNDPDIPTRPKTSPGLSIIDLSLTTLELGPLEAWETYPGRPTGSDHEVIGMRWAPLAPKPPRTPREGVTGWRIKELQEDEEAMKAAAETWRALSQAQAPLGDTCTREDIAQEAEWISEALTEVLNQHAKPIWVTPFSKRWWTDPVREARRQYAGARRLWQQGCIEDEHHRTARQTYYKAIRQAKRECWEAFLQGSQEPGHHPPGTPPTPDEAARCWLALKYTKPQDQGTTPTLYRAQGNTQAATTFQEKETLIREAAFPQAPRDRPVQCPPLGNAHTEATESAVKQALFSQATQKAPGVDQLNFQALRLLWKWDSQRIVTLARQCLRLGFHPPSWKVAKGILLRKPNKTNYSLVKAYRVISLLNCLGKVVEKMVATQIAEFCEQKQTLHNGQMGARRHRSAPDAVGCLIEEVHQSWAAKQLAATLFMDIKGAFDHVNAALLVNRLEAMGLDGSLVNWVASFLSDRQVQLVIDGHPGLITPISSGLPQGSPASPILFLIYIQGAFPAIEQATPGIRALSFADDVGLIARGNSVQGVCSQLQAAGEAAIAWGIENGVQFDHEKTEAALFSRQSGRRLREQIERARITIRGHPVSFSLEATRWLGVLLDSGLTLKAHYQDRLQKATRAEARIRALCKTQGLPPGLIWRLQKAVVHAIALYGAELWWRGQKDREQGLQGLINKQARAITGAFKTTPIGPLVREAALEPASSLLDARQRAYAARLMGLPETQPARAILPVTFREGDCHAQPGEQPADDRTWAEERPPRPLGQYLAWKVNQTLATDPSGGFEQAEPEGIDFPGIIRVPQADQAREEAHKMPPQGTFWSDGSRLEDGRVGAGIAWKTEGDSQWHIKGRPMGKGAEVFDAELVGVVEALQEAEKQATRDPVTILLDSQAAIARLRHTRVGPGQVAAIEAANLAQGLVSRGQAVTIQWVPAHCGVEGNEKADQAAKAAATRPPIPTGGTQGQLSLAHLRRTQTKATREARERWLREAMAKRTPAAQRTYRPHRGWRLDPAAAGAPKALASRYYQLKMGHAAIGPYLQRVQAQESAACQGCGAPRESVHHLLLECRERAGPRRTLFQGLREAGAPRPATREIHPEVRLFGDPRATPAILRYLQDTGVGARKTPREAQVQARAQDEWGWGALEGAEQMEGD
ncbi:hypothetical protein SI65_04139 [Aspergillus cristatus]|nr:hypothetical protein SI65_04139 [Aspergillus cristatus]